MNKFSIRQTVRLVQANTSVPVGSFGRVIAFNDRKYRVQFPSQQPAHGVMTEAPIISVAENNLEIGPPHEITPEQVTRFLYRFEHCGGIAIWDSADPDDPSTVCAPLLGPDGLPFGRQESYWGSIIRIISHPSEVVVLVPKIVQTIKTKMEINGKLNEFDKGRVVGAIKRAEEKYGVKPWVSYIIGDARQVSALIFVPEAITPLTEWGIPTQSKWN